MYKKILISVISLLAVMTVMTGCGTEQNNDTKTTEPVSIETSAETSVRETEQETSQKSEDSVKATEQETSQKSEDSVKATEQETSQKSEDSVMVTEHDSDTAEYDNSVQDPDTAENSKTVQYEERNLIDGFYLGMDIGETLSLLDESLINEAPTYTSTDDEGNTNFIIDIGCELPLETQMRSSIIMKTDENFAVTGYGYLIGCSVDQDKQDLVCPYTVDELIAEYDKIYQELCTWYGEGSESDIDGLDTIGIIKYKQWNSPEYGHIEFFAGENLFDENGLNTIYLQIS